MAVTARNSVNFLTKSTKRERVDNIIGMDVERDVGELRKKERMSLGEPGKRRLEGSSVESKAPKV